MDMNINLKSILKFYAVSPIHAGSGDSTATVDLPIQRERHTNYPVIHASGVKGAMRDFYRRTDKKPVDINFIFGSDSQDEWDKSRDSYNKDKEDKNKIDSAPGAFSVSDAKLLAFPMRSNIAPFVWVTCPYILKRFAMDLEFAGIKSDLKHDLLEKDTAVIINGSLTGNVILEDAVVKTISGTGDYSYLLEKFKDIDKLLLISDEMFDYCVTCTEIQTNIKIDSRTGTAQAGALRYQEFLPSDSVLYSVVYFGNSMLDSLKADSVKKHIEETIKPFIQIGGDETVGKGICKIEWIEGGK